MIRTQYTLDITMTDGPRHNRDLRHALLDIINRYEDDLIEAEVRVEAIRGDDR